MRKVIKEYRITGTNIKITQTNDHLYHILKGDQCLEFGYYSIKEAKSDALTISGLLEQVI